MISLREVEPETNLVITLAAPEVADRPAWTFAPHTGQAAPDDSDEDDDAAPADEAGLLTAAPVLVAEGEPTR